MIEEKIIEYAEFFKKEIQEHNERMSKIKSINMLPDNDFKDISIFLRIKPLMEYEIQNNSFETCLPDKNNHYKAYIYEPTFRFDEKPIIKTQNFNFDYVFGPNDNNKIVYDHSIQNIIEISLAGALGVILCYGQTGSGKTFTITGIEEYLAVDLFKKMDRIINDMQLNTLETYNNRPFEIKVSFFEILGNRCYDLLNNKEEIFILEDKFRNMTIKGVQEFDCLTSDDLLKYINIGFSHRKTHATLKNDTSSRSHAICQIRIHNTVINQANDGIIYLVDLAGSERHADSKFHDKERLKETKEINSSLLTLKECIRARTLSTMGLRKHIHIPFRNSKITTLLKETFDIESCTRPCTTIFIANVSSNCIDYSHTLNTIRYASSLKVTQKSSYDPLKKKEYDPKDPSSWEYKHVVQWIEKASNGAINPEFLVPNKENGVQLCNIPEMEFIRRCLLSKNITEKRAKLFYLKLWGLIIDCRTKQRKAKLTSKPKKKHSFSQDEEMIKRYELEKKLGIYDAPKETARKVLMVFDGK